MTTTMEPTGRQPLLSALRHLVTGTPEIKFDLSLILCELWSTLTRYRGVDGYRRARCDSGTGDTFRQVAADAQQSLNKKMVSKGAKSNADEAAVHQEVGDGEQLVRVRAGVSQ